MFKQLVSPLFIKPFIAILSAFLFTAILFFSLLIYQDEKTSIRDFVIDTEFAAHVLKDTYSNDPSLFEPSVRLLEHQVGLSATILNESDLDSQLSQAELIPFEHDIRSETTRVYFDHKAQVLFTVYPLTSQALYLIVSDITYDDKIDASSDINHQILQREDEQKSFFFQALLILLLLYFLLTGGILLLAIRSISRHIYTLSDASQTFAQGDLDMRLQTDIPAPLDILATSFNKMAQTLQGTMHEQEVMSNAISHELKTPLTRLQLAAGLASAKSDNTDVKSLIESMEKNIDELDKLTNAVLTIARLNHNSKTALEFQRVDIAALLQERIFLASNLDENILITSHFDQPMSVDGNELLLQMALDNLLTNAVAYANHEVQVSVRQRPSGHLEIMINDDGEGISNEYKDSVFMPFSRVDESRDRKSGGFGLGLAIVKSIALKHNGTIACTQGNLSGAAFVLCLPVAKP